MLGNICKIARLRENISFFVPWNLNKENVANNYDY